MPRFSAPSLRAIALAGLCLALTACAGGKAEYPGDRPKQPETAYGLYKPEDATRKLAVYGREDSGIKLEKNRQNPPLCQAKVGTDYYGRPTQRCTDRRNHPFMGD